MKILKINTSFFALLIGFGLVFGFSAFKKTHMVRYQFNNPTSANVNQVSAWTNVTSTEPNECAPGDALPCIIEFDTDGAYPNLASYLSSKNTVALINASPEIREQKASE